jgi:aminopeptidase N
MKKNFLIFSILISTAAFAQSNESQEDTSWKKIYRAEATRINDLVDTKLEVKFDFDKSYMYGKEWLTLHDSLTLDAKGMNINEVSLFAWRVCLPKCS